MIINSLRLHNFMSYSDAALDLTGIDVACLSGQNGAGKSALLDAITWSLWENARSSSEELIKLGEKEMWVDLTFVHEGERYRVRRSRHKTSSRSGTRTVSKGTLELQIFKTDAKILLSAVKSASSSTTALATSASSSAGASRFDSEHSVTSQSASDHSSTVLDTVLLLEEAVSTAVVPSAPSQAAEPAGSWRSLSSGNSRETQTTICNLLRMNFETFVNSVYLRQGKADEFTTRPPADRKQVLAEILGLSYFDRLQEKSKEKARQLRVRADYLTASISDKAEVEKLFEQANLDLQSFQLVLADLSMAVAQVTEEHHDIDLKCRQADLLAQQQKSNGQQAQRLRKDIELLSKQLEEFEDKIQAMQSILIRKVEIELAVNRFNALKAQSEILDLSALRLQELTAAKLEEQTKLANIRSRLEYEFGGAQSTLNETESRIIKLTHDTADGDAVEANFLGYRQLIKEETSLAARQELFTKLSNRVGELQAIINESRIHLEAEVGQKELKIEELENLLHSETILRQRKSELESAIAALEQFEIEFELVEQTGLEIKLKLEKKEQQISDLKRKQRENEEKIKELQRQNDSSICPLCSATIVDRAAVVDCYRCANADADSQIDAVVQEITILEVERLGLRKRYAKLRAQLEERQPLDVRIGHFNEKLATIERARESVLITKDEIETLKERIDKHDFAQLERASLIAIKAEIYKLDFDPVLHANLQAQLRAQRGIESRYVQHKKDLAELQRLRQDAPLLREKRQLLSDQLTSESYGDEMRDALKNVQLQINELAYDRAGHEQVKKELAQLLPDSELFRDLQRALAEEPNLRQSALSCAEMIANKSEQTHLLEHEAEEMESLLTEMPALKAALGEKQMQAQELALKRDAQLKTAAVAEANLQRLSEDLTVLAARGNELNQLKQEIDDYSFLADAFGKKGIQAVIIENAIPEIEAEANKILSRLSDNKMHVGLVTQHKNKSGSINETLDLLIGDEVGTRNYELFSGGEAFKVNFAIRVALSKLLARRSGARLETLIIDEGFGSQDEASRERLVRAIRAIQTDFARILVITHMADIREMFPIQIQVKKVNGSSRLQFAY